MEKIDERNDAENKKPDKITKKKNDKNESITGKPEDQIKRYDKTENTLENGKEHIKRNENDSSEDETIDQLDAEYFTHLLSQNKSATWLSTELLDDDFLEYLIEKVDRYFQARNLKVQIVESVKKIDQEVFGGILPSAETGE